MAQRVFTQTFGVVGALIEKEGKFLLVQEANVNKTDQGKWNHPAGWIDVGEDPLEAAKREVKEETGLDFTPTHVLGFYSLVRQDLEKSLGSTPHALKLIFLGKLSDEAAQALHDDVSETRWFTPEEINQLGDQLRDVDIKAQVNDYLNGKRYPLELLTHTISN